MVPRRSPTAQGAAMREILRSNILLPPHEADDVLDRLHGFGGERL
jgi:hypothetical protein